MTHLYVFERPNGWELKINDEEYLYFTKKEVAMGFLCHFLMDEKAYLNKNEITELVDACLQWKDKDKDKAVKELMKLQKDYDYLKGLYEGLQKKCKNYIERMKKAGVWSNRFKKKDDDEQDDDDDMEL